MKKISLILAALMLLSLLTLTACDGGNTSDETTAAEATTTEPATEAATTAPETTTPAPTKITYKVTVVDQDGNPVAAVDVQMCDDTGCRLPQSTGEDGTVTFTFPASNFHVTLPVVPDGYTAEAEYNFADGEYELTATITKN